MNGYLASIGPELANHVWQSTLFAMAVWVVTLLLRGNRAQVRYRLWLAASIKFFVPFSLLVDLGKLLPKAPEAALQARPGLYSAVDIVSQPFLNLTPLPASAHVVSLTDLVMTWLPFVLGAIWLCGVVVALLVWLARWRQVSRILEQAVLAEGGREWEILRQVDARLPLMRSQESMEPGILGVFRPVLLWPERLSARLDDEHIEAIMLHELMHVWRRDNLTAALHMLIEAIFWFHPLVWWIERRMVEERERACDEAVIQMGGSAEAYAESLVKACRFCVESPLTCVSGITGADLNQRIVAIMQHKLGGRLGLGKAALLLVMGAAVIAGPLVFGQVDTALHAAILVSPKLLSAPPPPPPPREWSTNFKPSIAFDVVSIKRNHDTTANANINSPVMSDNMSITNLPVAMMISVAYNLPLRDQLDGLPAWALNDRYDVVAKVAGADVTVFQKYGPEQRSPMLQPVIEDRFKMKAHYGTKELPVYALVAAKGGSKLTSVEPVIGPNGMKSAGNINVTREGSTLKMRAVGIPIDIMLRVLSLQLGRTIENQTGLTGNYDFTMRWTPDQGAGVSASNSEEDSSAPSIFTALQEQLGLKLESTKGPVRVLVVDHIEQPSDN
jgi:bla regulator protein blaR1